MNAVVRFHYERDGFRFVTDREMPKVGDYDVLIKVKAAGLCGSDIHSINGRSNMQPIGTILGHEFCGEVAEVGKKVTRWKVGDRAVSDTTGYVCGTCPACLKGEYTQCKDYVGLGNGLDGSFAEYCLIPGAVLQPYPQALMPLPDNIPYDEAAILDPLCNGYLSVIQHGGLRPGETVCITGVGPLGLSAIQMAKIAGASRIIVLVRKSTNPLHRSVAWQMGATDMLESEDMDTVREFVRDMTDGEGVDLIVDNAGPYNLYPMYFDILRHGGKIVKVGYGAGVEGPVLNTAMLRSQSIVGQMAFNPVSWRNCIKLLASGIASQKPLITHVLPLSEYQKGVDLMRSRECIKVVFHPEEG